MGNSHKNQNDQKLFAENVVPFNTIKLISAGSDRNVKNHSFDIADQMVKKKIQLSAQSTKSVIIVRQQKCSITSIAMNNGTHTLFVANYRGIITQFQKEDSSLNYYPVRTFKGHTDGINQISHSNFKMHLLSASFDKTLRVWDLQNGTQLVCLNEEGIEHGIQNPILSCCWNDEDTLFASGDWVGGVVVWSPPLSIYNTSNQFIPLCKFKIEQDNSNIHCLKFQENGLDLFTSYEGLCSGVIRLWSINEKELLESKSTHQQNATLPLIQQPKLQSEQLNGSIWSFDVRGSMLVVGVNNEILSLSADSLQSMADAMKFEKVHNRLISKLVFRNDGKYVASGNDAGSVAIFDSKNGKCVRLIKNAHSYWVRAIEFY